MREIKFRAWNGTIMLSNYDLFDWDLEHLTQPDEEIWELMQYTGLKDKNGREIYEGDIVVFVSNASAVLMSNAKPDYETRAVVYDENNAAFKMCAWAFSDYSQEIEVIGNLCENGDLLNDADN